MCRYLFLITHLERIGASQTTLFRSNHGSQIQWIRHYWPCCHYSMPSGSHMTFDQSYLVTFTYIGCGSKTLQQYHLTKLQSLHLYSFTKQHTLMHKLFSAGCHKFSFLCLLSFFFASTLEQILLKFNLHHDKSSTTIRIYVEILWLRNKN